LLIYCSNSKWKWLWEVLKTTNQSRNWFTYISKFKKTRASTRQFDSIIEELDQYFEFEEFLKYWNHRISGNI
jgi:hypothetical protein